jgi:hypothetical protein
MPPRCHIQQWKKLQKSKSALGRRVIKQNKNITLTESAAHKYKHFKCTLKRRKETKNLKAKKDPFI